MRASAIEFRLRMLIMAIIIFLGFWSPWIEFWDSSATFAQRISVLEWLPLELSRLRLLNFGAATPVVIVCGAFVAGVGAAMRVWGSAYLGSTIVQHRQMQAGVVMASGPYRYVRNPLYLGLWCMMAAMAFLMPPTGALVSMVLITAFLLRLIWGEEAFLATQLGQPYRDYQQAVPRLIPRLRTSLPPGNNSPVWLQATLTEINPIGVFFTLAVLSWSYNNTLMIKGVLVSFGLSLIVRALLPGKLVQAAVGK